MDLADPTTGDACRDLVVLAEAAGGRVEDSLPNAAAWVPVSVTTRKDGSKGVMPHFIDRAKPGVIAVMRDGKILQIGSPRDIYERPAERFVANFIGESNFLDARLADGVVTLAAGGRDTLRQCPRACPTAR